MHNLTIDQQDSLVLPPALFKLLPSNATAAAQAQHSQAQQAYLDDLQHVLFSAGSQQETRDAIRALSPTINILVSLVYRNTQLDTVIKDLQEQINQSNTAYEAADQENDDIKRQQAQERLKKLAPEYAAVIEAADPILLNGSFLHHAAEIGDLGLFEYLVSLGFEVTAADEQGMLPIHHAALHDSVAIVDYLCTTHKQSLLGTMTTEKFTQRDNVPAWYFACLRPVSNIVKNNINGQTIPGLGQSVLTSDEFGRTAYHYTAMAGNVAVLRSIHSWSPGRENGVDCDNRGAMPHHYAAASGHVDALQFFMNPRLFTISLDATDQEDCTVAHYAAQSAKDDATMVTHLVAQGVDFSARDAKQRTVLHHAARHSAPAVFDALWALDLDINQVMKTVDADAMLPLHPAFAAGNTLAAKRLLKAFNHRVILMQEKRQFLMDGLQDHPSPLHLAAAGGHVACFELGLAATGESDSFPWLSFVDEKQQNCLTTAMRGQAVQLISRITQAMADDDVEQYDEILPLPPEVLKHIFSYLPVKSLDTVALAGSAANGIAREAYQSNFGQARIAQALGEQAELDAFPVYRFQPENNSDTIDKIFDGTKRNLGHIPVAVLHTDLLHRVAAAGDLGFFQFLAQHGFDVNAPDAKGLLPIHHAAQHDHVDIVKYCVYQHKQSANSHYTAENYRSQIHVNAFYFACASKAGQKTVSWLMDKLAKKNWVAKKRSVIAADKMGRTRLHYALWSGNHAAVDQLIDAGADIYRKDMAGMGAYHFAAMSGNLALCVLCEQAGLAADERDHAGQSPALLSGIGGNWAAVYYLSQRPGADVMTTTDHNNCNLQFKALERGHVSLLQEMTKQSAALGATFNHAQTASDNRHLGHIAASSGSVAVIDYLFSTLVPGITVDTVSRKRDNSGRSPFNLLAWSGNTPALKAFLNHLPDDATRKEQFTQMPYHGGKRALHYACMSQQLPMMLFVAQQWPEALSKKDLSGRVPSCYINDNAQYQYFQTWVFLTLRWTDLAKTVEENNSVVGRGHATSFHPHRSLMAWLHPTIPRDKAERVIHPLKSLSEYIDAALADTQSVYGGDKTVRAQHVRLLETFKQTLANFWETPAALLDDINRTYLAENDDNHTKLMNAAALMTAAEYQALIVALEKLVSDLTFALMRYSEKKFSSECSETYASHPNKIGQMIPAILLTLRQLRHLIEKGYVRSDADQQLIDAFVLAQQVDALAADDDPVDNQQALLEHPQLDEQQLRKMVFTEFYNVVARQRSAFTSALAAAAAGESLEEDSSAADVVMALTQQCEIFIAASANLPLASRLMPAHAELTRTWLNDLAVLDVDANDAEAWQALLDSLWQHAGVFYRESALIAEQTLEQAEKMNQALAALPPSQNDIETVFNKHLSPSEFALQCLDYCNVVIMKPSLHSEAWVTRKVQQRLQQFCQNLNDSLDVLSASNENAAWASLSSQLSLLTFSLVQLTSQLKDDDLPEPADAPHNAVMTASAPSSNTVSFSASSSSAVSSSPAPVPVTIPVAAPIAIREYLQHALFAKHAASQRLQDLRDACHNADEDEMIEREDLLAPRQ